MTMMNDDNNTLKRYEIIVVMTAPNFIRNAIILSIPLCHVDVVVIPIQFEYIDPIDKNNFEGFSGHRLVAPKKSSNSILGTVYQSRCLYFTVGIPTNFTDNNISIFRKTQK